MYQIIILYNEENQRSYYHSYVRSDDKTLGNISTDKLPATQDILQAQSYWWDFDTESWIYDSDMYQKLLNEEEEKEKEAEVNKRKAEAQLTNDEIAEALMEIGQNQSDLFEAVAELGKMIATLLK